MTDTQIAIPPRSEIPLAYQWNAESVFPDREAWEAEYSAIAAALPTLGALAGHLAESPTALAEALELAYSLQERLQRVYFYAGMCYAVELTDTAAETMNGRAQALAAQASATASFIEPEMIAIGNATLLKWLATEPRLTIYAQYIDNLFRQQAHVRSPEVEEVLGLAQAPLTAAASIYDVLTSNDMKFAAARSGTATTPVAQSSRLGLMRNPDREIRRTAWESFSDAHLAMKNTLANTLSTTIRRDIFYARTRRYDSALEAALTPINVPVEVFHTLIDTFKRNLPTWHRYWAVRRRALGLSDLHTYDIWAPLTTASPRMTYEQAVDYICAGMAPLGDEYVSTLRRGCLEQRWVDVLPNQAKVGGAFSGGSKGTYPFIMMSYTHELESMGVLAHELGHSMHSYFTNREQPMVYTDYSLFVAEVASNFNQAMVRAYLFDHVPDRNFQLGLIGEAMDNFHRYFFIMPTLARFELEFHERVERGESPTADDLNTLMAELYAEGYGSEVTIDRGRDGITWATFGHLYANFYVFQYATGISAANALSQRVLTGGASAAADYLGFLKAGSSRYPLDVLKSAGVDLTTPQPIEQAFAVLSSLVDRLEALIDYPVQ